MAIGLLERGVVDDCFQSGLAVFFSTTSSTNVFHSPHDGQLPNHFAA
jgi:hypothetical protein